MKSSVFCFVAALALAAMSAFCDEPALFKGETMIFPTNASSSQMASVVIVTSNKKIIVFDGGTVGDADHLTEIVKQYGDTVDYWFLTHAHNDHCGAIIGLFDKNPNALKVRKVLFSFPDKEWLKDAEKWSANETEWVFEGMKKVAVPQQKVHKGDKFVIDGVVIDVLNDSQLFRGNAGNNSSIIYSVMIGGKRAIIPGDIGTEMSDFIIKEYGDKLKADIVLMSHHGQNGATKEFYEKVAPSIAVWPTPQWLWDNNNGGGVGSGPWKTNYVKCWMQDLKVTKQYVTTADVILK